MFSKWPIVRPMLCKFVLSVIVESVFSITNSCFTNAQYLPSPIGILPDECMLLAINMTDFFQHFQVYLPPDALPVYPSYYKKFFTNLDVTIMPTEVTLSTYLLQK